LGAGTSSRTRARRLPHEAEWRREPEKVIIMNYLPPTVNPDIVAQNPDQYPQIKIESFRLSDVTADNALDWFRAARGLVWHYDPDALADCPVPHDPVPAWFREKPDEIERQVEEIMSWKLSAAELVSFVEEVRNERRTALKCECATIVYRRLFGERLDLLDDEEEHDDLRDDGWDGAPRQVGIIDDETRGWAARQLARQCKKLREFNGGGLGYRSGGNDLLTGSAMLRPAPGQYSQRRRMGGSTEACRGAVSR
jgi:hypothetical protein